MKNLSLRMMAWGIALVSLLILLPSVTALPHVGFSSYLLVQHLGIEPIPLFANPLYGWIVKFLSAVSGGAALYVINLFSALCGAGVVAMVFLHVHRAVRGFNDDHVAGPVLIRRVQLVAGLGAVLFLLASTPFILASTRANPLTFDLLLVLVSFYLVLAFGAGVAFARLGLAVVLYGVAMVEFTTAIVLAPLFGVLVVVRLWQAGMLTFRHLALSVGCALAGWSLYLVQAGLYMATPAYDWREFTGFFQVLGHILVEQYQSITGGLPRVGWLSLSLVSFLPWVVTASFRMTSNAGQKTGAIIGTLLLYVIMAGLAVLLLVPDFPLAPVTLTGTGRLFVTPYLFIALWVGHVIAFWMVVCFREKRFDHPGWKKARAWAFRVGLTGAAAFMVFTLATRALPAARDPVERAVYAFSKQVIERAADKEWLLTSTMLDDQLAVEAHLRRLPLKVLRLSYGRSVPHMRYVASLLDKEPRLQSLARIGMSPLMDEWFLEIDQADQKVAVVHVPDLWLMSGFDAIPDEVLFEGVKSGVSVPLDDLLARNRSFWDAISTSMQGLVADASTPQGVALGWIRTHISKIANNLGVYLEDQGRTDDAYACYRQARVFDPDNLSALMNLHVLAQREQRPEFEELEAELAKRTENLVGRVQTWSLSHVYGFVRVPELFVNRGLSFAVSGKASMAISDMKRALSLSRQNPQIQLALGGLYFGQDRSTESREQYEQVLAGDPGNVSARLGLMRLAVRDKEYKAAREHLEALRATDIKPSILRMEEAVLESMAGSPEVALSLLRQVVQDQPDNMQAWAAVAVTAVQLKDKATADEALERLRQGKNLAPGVLLAMAQAAVAQGDRDTARRHLGDILRRQPGNIHALEMSLRLDMYEGSRDQIMKSVERILVQDPRNALANYMLGVNHYYNKEYALAESAYRASLASLRSPEALNDLAYVLYLQGNLAEAGSMVRESLDINDRNAAAWDTLGVVLMEQGKLVEAEEALQRSLGLRPNAASVMLSLAVLYEKRERFDEAGRVANDINARLNELSPQDQTRLQRLLDRLAERAL